MTEQHTQQTEGAPQGTEAAVPEKPSLKERVAGVLAHPKAPLWAGAAILAIAGAAALYLKGPALSVGSFGRPAFVLFDPVRFTNAQRAAASIMAVSPNADTALALTQVAKQAEAVIRQEAHGAVVLVKQAVVAPEGMPDITEAVLERFGLPTNVPTITTNLSDDSLESIAPTDNAFSQGKLREDYRLELEGKRARLAEQQTRQAGQANILP
ncbi:hypothetical protein WJ96_04055 [Burkholderia ubonensis]|uniref:Uncharacterized protein n=1 Tax=Burkholderia ubonensis TaxID=101571 RepID=A0AAW3MS55_9BURK|nr:hypothetical protein [Burkholderia ubonensis]KVP65549.1 hypothetical protein WJ93_23800 [Burkholderia ubonensis]KVP97749.1 hypothetical protein WJ96_04055 [Burkholderia ubonensis]KVZ92446.1 hypothetical protein WL25_15710 [Burkholderia ubonensis]